LRCRDDGRLVRSLGVSPDTGIVEDIGEPYPFERPYWAGEHPVTSTFPGQGPYPLPFHPLDLDEEALRALLYRSLTSLGYEVHSARDGAEAIALCEAAKASGRVFDAVLLDLTVSGGMGGVETAARLRELDPAVKLIVSSGYSDAPVMSKFREYGFDDVIPKPWQTAEVSEVFRRVLLAERGPTL